MAVLCAAAESGELYKNTRKCGNCNLRPPNASPVLIRFNYDAHAKFEVAQPIRCHKWLLSTCVTEINCDNTLPIRLIAIYRLQTTEYD